jgi:hypothetical protein
LLDADVNGTYEHWVPKNLISASRRRDAAFVPRIAATGRQCTNQGNPLVSLRLLPVSIEGRRPADLL